MQYELARALKDAGFNPEYKQTRENTYSYVDSDGNPCGALGKNAVYIPTLEELIDAIELASKESLQISRHSDRSGWMVKLTPNLWQSAAELPDALAQLWLALNPNKVN